MLLALAAVACTRSAPERSLPAVPVVAETFDEEAPLATDHALVVEANSLVAARAGVVRTATLLEASMRAPVGNFAYSPASVAAALAMSVALGGSDAARDPLVAHLGGTTDVDTLHRAASVVLRSWVMRGAGVDAVHRVFASHELAVDGGARRVLREVYGVPLGRMVSSGPEGARARINRAVAEATQAAITDFAASDAVVADAPWLVVSAVVLRMSCVGEVATGTFRVSGVDEATVATLRCREGVSSARGDGYTMWRIAGVGERTWLEIAVPDEEPLRMFEQRVSARDRARTLERATPAPAGVEVPAMSIGVSAAVELRDVFIEAGLGRWFDPQHSGMTTPQGRPLWISSFLHRVQMTLVASPTRTRTVSVVSARVMRPFVFEVRTRDTGLPLIVGRVYDPRP
jgi:serine protease inhibitor